MTLQRCCEAAVEPGRSGLLKAGGGVKDLWIWNSELPWTPLSLAMSGILGFESFAPCTVSAC